MGKTKVAMIKAFNSDEWIRITVNDHDELYIENAKPCPRMKEDGKPKIITYFHCDHCSKICDESIPALGYWGKWGEFNENSSS